MTVCKNYRIQLTRARRFLSIYGNSSSIYVCVDAATFRVGKLYGKNMGALEMRKKKSVVFHYIRKVIFREYF